MNNIQKWTENSPAPTYNLVEKDKEKLFYFSTVTHLYKKDALVVMTVQQLRDMLKHERQFSN